MTKDLKAIYDNFLKKCQKIEALEIASGILSWDQLVMMPSKGAEMRAQSCAALSEVIHELIIEDQMWTMVSELNQAREEGLISDQVARANIYLVYRDAKRARCIPAKLASEISLQESLAYEAWVKSRQKNDFSLFAPELKKILELIRQKAELCLKDSGDLYTALLQDYEPEYTVDEIKILFNALRNELVPLVAKVSSLPPPDQIFLKQEYKKEKLEALSQKILGMMGLALGENSRMDVTEHPFMSGKLDDLRIATRYTDGIISLYSILHEGGHALYEANLPCQYAGQPVCSTISLGYHEAQSRFWEVIIGGSQEFINYFFPFLGENFPQEFKKESAESVFKGLNIAQPSTIRVNADPLTYNLHILLRFDLEEKMLKGDLEVEDLPVAWDEAFEKLFGFKPASYSEGCGQDVHWSEGMVGYFPTYTLGNMRSAQILEKIEAEYPDLWPDIAAGNFTKVREWLSLNIYQQGSLYTAKELDRRAMGELDHKYLINFLKKRFGEAYGVTL